MALDWSKLQPHQALPPGDPRYVEHPNGTGEAIAKWIAAGRSTALVIGPVGTGKSTELARATELLKTARTATYVALDRVTNLRALNAQVLTGRLVMVLWGMTERLRIPLSEEFRSGLAKLKTALKDHQPVSLASARDQLVSLAREVARRGGKRGALLVDGLEKASPDVVTVALETLAAMPAELDLVVVVPISQTYGARVDFIRPGERLFAHGPHQGPAALAFFQELVGRRLCGSWESLLQQLPSAPVASHVEKLTDWSSGLPRDFLQLLTDAATYAQLNRGEQWPDESDLTAARADFIESFRRSLQPGDEAALLRVEGTDGRELELARKLRMLTQGLLIEVPGAKPGEKLMRPHNLVRPLLGYV